MNLLSLRLAAGNSEAWCETIGSQVERNHTSRFLSAGKQHTDNRLQREMFVRINGPSLQRSSGLISQTVSRMMDGSMIGPTGKKQAM